MKTHRIRSAKSTDQKTRPHIFVELEQDRWIEVAPTITHVAIHNFLAQEKKKDVIYVSYAERAFHIGIVKNWTSAGYLT